MQVVKRGRLGFVLNRLIGLILVSIILMSLSGCGALDKTLAFVGAGGGPAMPDTPESLAVKGLDEFNHGNYHSALKIFEEIKDRFPFSESSLLAELKAADSHYYMEHYGEAFTLYGEFEGSHPTNEAIPYVLFQMGMCNYAQIDTIDRDPGSAGDAIQIFTRLVRAFPQSPYVEEARARIAEARDFLASHEMYVATFYVRIEEFDQAEGRLEYLLANYSDTSVAPEAQKLLKALESGNPPERTWRSWLPDLSLPTWKSLNSSFSAAPGAAGSPPGGD